MFDSREPESKGEDVAPTLPHSGASVSYVTLALAIGVKRNTLHKWVMLGCIPQPTKHGARIARWTQAQFEEIKTKGKQPPGTYRRARGATVPQARLCLKHLCELICPTCSKKKPAAKKPAAKKTAKKKGRAK